jgi:hypothetical protein
MYDIMNVLFSKFSENNLINLSIMLHKNVVLLLAHL